MTERIAIYGGSFDPVHYGHLWVAENAREQLSLDRVIFVPAATSPLKPHGPVAGDAQRLAMLRLALAEAADSTDLPSLIVDQRELLRGGTSFTIDTVEAIRADHPDDELYLLIGSDAFAAIRLWHRPAELLNQIVPIVFRRGGDPEIDWNVLDGIVSAARCEQIRRASVNLPMIELSSGEIRERVAAGRSIRFRVPREVERLIATESLYQAEGSSG